jgi:hypothetical protein
VGEVMELVYDILGFIMFGFLGLMMYVNLHMEEEKRAKERMPLMWEEGGFLRTFWNKVITKKSKKK